MPDELNQLPVEPVQEAPPVEQPVEQPPVETAPPAVEPTENLEVPPNPNYQRYMDLYQGTATGQPTTEELPQLTPDDIARLRQMVNVPEDTPTEPQPDPSDPLDVANQRLRNGDVRGFVESVAEALRPMVKPEDQASQSDLPSLAELTALMDVRSEMQTYASQVRQANQDLVPLGDLVESRTTAYFEQAKASGNIKDVRDASDAYKAAVDKAIAEVRQIRNVIRGEGAQNVNRVTQTITASTPGGTQETQTAPPVAPPDNSEDSTRSYLEIMRERRERMKNPIAFTGQ